MEENKKITPIIHLPEEIKASGVGTSKYYKDLMEGAFIVDIGKESVASALALINANKNTDKKVIIVHNDNNDLKGKLVNDIPTVEKLKQLIDNKDVSNVIFFIEDIEKVINEENKNVFEREPMLIKKLYNHPEPYIHYSGAGIGKKKTRKGINNRKSKKRKKAKNGRNKK